MSNQLHLANGHLDVGAKLLGGESMASEYHAGSLAATAAALQESASNPTQPAPFTTLNPGHFGSANPYPQESVHMSSEPQVQSHQPFNNEQAHSNQATWPTEVQSAPETERPQKTRAAVHFQMPKLGILDQLMADDRVSDILVNGVNGIYTDRAGALEDSGLRFNNHEEIWEVAEAIMGAIGRHWTADVPMIDTRLPDGSRVNMVGPPIAVDGVSISIRKFPKTSITLERMAETGLISNEIAIFMKECVRQRMNIIVAGSTSSGKTTMLNALSSGISLSERVVTIEDSAELRLQQPHVVRLEALAAKHTDQGIAAPAVTMRDLVKNALRMRPDRIILGESRGPEAFDVLQAMNTGHAGSMTTLHANTPRDSISRLETMVSIAMPQLALRVVRQQIASAVNLVIQMSRTADGVRHISHISELCGMEGETMVMQDLVTYVEAANNKPAHYRWASGSPRNKAVTDAARTAGLMKTL